MASLIALYRAWRFKRYRQWLRSGCGTGVIRQVPKFDARDKQSEFYRLMRDRL